jgi:hypothetical protein
MTTTSLIAAADGRRVHFRALGTRYVVTADATAGAFAIVEHDLARMRWARRCTPTSARTRSAT